MESRPDKPFVLNNDTLLLAYTFYNGNVNIDLFNKSKTPLYIDWRRSALIVDNISWSYKKNQRTAFSKNKKRPRYVKSAIRRKTTTSFLPPNTGIKTARFRVKNLLRALPLKLDEKQEFTTESSPFRFRSYLYLSYDQDFAKPVFIDHTFWLSNRIRSGLPLQMPLGQTIYLFY
ncbi:MAG: hypothetical protein WDO15_11660 [Bacteroidota bacterium]